MMNVEVEEIQFARGKPLFIVEGFIYTPAKRALNRYYCGCVRYKSESCTARVTIEKVNHIRIDFFSVV